METNIISKKYDFNQKFITNEKFDKFYDDNRNNPEVIDKKTLHPDKQKLFDQYEFLINLPQPVQKSPEWFALRNNMVTASSCGSVLGECKYQTIKETTLEKIFGKEFKENKFVYHGKKYEKIATMIYEVIYNSKVGEFGLIPHQKINFLGASPDGVSMSLTLDGKPNQLLGRMLEIKCPPARAILNTGKIKGDICPSYYWIQVQIQLECCDLSECDFWQTHLIEYKGEKEFIVDEITDDIHTHSEIYEQDSETEIIDEKNEVVIDERIRRGAIIELLPIDRSAIPKEDLVEWYGKYIYPPTLLMSPIEYRLWARETVKNIETLYPEFNGKYKFSRVVYWKLIKSHNELITRQTEWFKKNYDVLRKFWERVIYYREHPNEAKEDIIGQRLSNDVFLLTDTPKLPKIKSVQQFKKDNIFIKSVSEASKTDLIDAFASSSDNVIVSTNENKAVKLPSKKLLVKKMAKQVDEWASSEDVSVVEAMKIKSVIGATKIKIKSFVKASITNPIDEWSDTDSDTTNKIKTTEKIVDSKLIANKTTEKTVASKLIANKTSTSKSISGKVISDKVISGKVISGKSISGKSISGKVIEKTVDNKTTTKKIKDKDPPKPELVYKSITNESNNSHQDADIDVVFIMENRKKKNTKK